MVDQQSPVRASTPVIPSKRPIEDDHAPNVPSPLNPDVASRPRPARAPAREQREKKDSLKKRESTGAVRGTTPDHPTKKQKIKQESEGKSGAPSPIRYNHPLPKEAFRYTLPDTTFASHEPEPFFAPDGVELKKPLDHAENKKAFRYVRCYADPSFTHSRYYRGAESVPYGPRLSFEDSDKWFHFDERGVRFTNEKGWRMGRANVVAREGTYYFEVKILKGVPKDGVQSSTGGTSSGSNTAPLPHIRMGWARREAPMDAPVGFDGYSYGLTDIRMEPMHKSRASKFLDDGSDKPNQTKKSTKSKSSKGKPNGTATTTSGQGGIPQLSSTPGFTANDNICTGDIIGLELALPSLSLHRRIVEGSYNPAVDVTSGLELPITPAPLNSSDDPTTAQNIVRDRFPVPYKGSMYFEFCEYRSSKGMEGYGDRGPFSRETPSPNHSDPTIRSLPHSSIKVYKNGKRIGTAFRNLMAFLPPASAPEVQKGSRIGMDDGALGYYPAVSAFSGGVAEVNLGPDFWFPPPGHVSSVSKREGGVRSCDPPTMDFPPKDEDEDHERKNNIPAGMEWMDGFVWDPKSIVEEDRVMAGAGLGTGIIAVGDRWYEQIAEDVWYDIVDEVDFEVQDAMDE